MAARSVPCVASGAGTPASAASKIVSAAVTAGARTRATRLRAILKSPADVTTTQNADALRNAALEVPNTLVQPTSNAVQVMGKLPPPNAGENSGQAFPAPS